MSDEYGWPDFPDPGHDDAGHHDPVPHDTPVADADRWHDDFEDHQGYGDITPQVDEGHDAGWEHQDAPGTAPDQPQPASAETADAHGLGPVGADPDAAGPAGEPVSAFPPVVDVGPLPEPVDGFPWIDTGSLGLVDAAAAATEPVSPQELAAYAAEELPPGADPWAALAGSEDPATAALARWWAVNG
ncbi:hypothetical protein [Couchioplanes caeruleus]|uniref:Uncharacterized protein n=2 Tax=Couchioplanes caeruleus TaxID=56438 RepID=A0A1K0H190_9ACTN|nr:hypothetical protein [Couchioplanes caeruleus]OJF15467.1 hypothetical protein BG844_04335 [Couchioplanes caeruleus subsp. caeruleus]ROP27513.1 hypothetical protein EDD30_0185 [Couchioplanes caeruleus]